LMPEVMLAAGDIINGWYADGEENQRVRRALIESWIHTFVSIGTNIVQTHQGLPSGVSVTAPLNSLCNWIYTLCVIFEKCDELGVSFSDDEIISNCEFAFYGDDHVLSVSEKMKPVLSFRIMKESMERHGIGYTDSAKSDKCDFDFEKLTEITYLKRKFEPLAISDVRAPLELESILKSMNWVRRRQGVSPGQALQEHFDSFCTELHQHGEEVYNEYVGILNMAIEEVQRDLFFCPELRIITNNYQFYEQRYTNNLYKI